MTSVDFKLYSILNVSKDCCQSEIKKAYRSLAMKLHPDKHLASNEETRKETEAQFKIVQNAYEILSNEEERKKYDQYGDLYFDKATHLHQHNSPFAPFAAFFNQMFNGQKPPSNSEQGQECKPPNITVQVNFTLIDAYVGNVKKMVQFQRQGHCTQCQGSGLSKENMSKENATNEGKSVPKCPVCNGAKIKQVHQQIGPMIRSFNVHCDECKRTGKNITAFSDIDLCDACKGSGECTEEAVIEVEIKKGTMNQSQTIVLNAGHKPNGDVSVIFIQNTVNQENESSEQQPNENEPNEQELNENEPNEQKQNNTETKESKTNENEKEASETETSETEDTDSETSGNEDSKSESGNSSRSETSSGNSDTASEKRENEILEHKQVQKEAIQKDTPIKKEQKEPRTIFERLAQAPQHLRCEITISLTEALFGAIITLTHMDGKKFIVKTPPYTYLHDGKLLLVRGKGMPIDSPISSHGDLFLEIAVETPTTEYLQSLSDDDVSLLKRLLPKALHEEKENKENEINKNNVEFIEADTFDDEEYEQDDDEQNGNNGTNPENKQCLVM